MTTKQINRWIGLGTAAVTLAAVGVLAWGLVAPVSVPVPSPAETPGGGQSADVSGADKAASRGPTLAQLQAMSAIDLRRPLRDPPPVQAAPTPLRARLVGTMYEPARPDQSLALFRLADGTERFFKPGQQFDDPAGAVTLKGVGDQTATIELRDERRELSAGTP